MNGTRAAQTATGGAMGLEVDQVQDVGHGDQLTHSPEIDSSRHKRQARNREEETVNCSIKRQRSTTIERMQYRLFVWLSGSSLTDLSALRNWPTFWPARCPRATECTFYQFLLGKRCPWATANIPDDRRFRQGARLERRFRERGPLRTLLRQHCRRNRHRNCFTKKLIRQVFAKPIASVQCDNRSKTNAGASRSERQPQKHCSPLPPLADFSHHRPQSPLADKLAYLLADTDTSCGRVL